MARLSIIIIGIWLNNIVQKVIVKNTFYGTIDQDTSDMKKYNIITICGPTASGKTRLAVQLSLLFNGEIISGDSRQVYRGMDIGTGKDLSDYSTPDGNIKHHLIDIADPHEEYNLFRYLQDFQTAYNKIISEDKIPFLTGGSGLYIEAALKGYNLPQVPVNPELREKLELLEKDELLEILKNESHDIFLKTDTSSTKRIIRGIEIAQSLNRVNLSSRPGQIEMKPLIICITPPRDELKKRITARLYERLDQDMTGETEKLIASGVSHERLIQLGLEYKYCALYIKGEITFDDMKEKLNTSINRFAKRQMTWFRGMERRGFKVHWIKGPDLKKARRIIEDEFSS